MTLEECVKEEFFLVNGDPAINDVATVARGVVSFEVALTAERCLQIFFVISAFFFFFFFLFLFPLLSSFFVLVFVVY
jgi:hypothetical protein